MKLVLIDRDGVVNEELPDCVKTVHELNIFPAALEGLALLTRQGFTCALVTNQSIVGRGIISPATLKNIHDALCEKVKAHGGEISDIFVCTDAPDAPTYRRKPKPGMLVEALEKYNAPAAITPFIGDAATDMQAALAAGCPRYLVLTGKGQKTAAALDQALAPVVICMDLFDAARKIVENF